MVGTRLIPLVLAVALGSLVSAALAARVGRKWPAAGSLAVAAIGLGLLADALDVDASSQAILIAMLVLGVGLGAAQAITTDTLPGARQTADAIATAGQSTTAAALVDASRDAFVTGVGWSMATGAVVTLVAAMVVARYLPHRNTRIPELMDA